MSKKKEISVVDAFMALKNDVIFYENYDPPYETEDILKINKLDGHMLEVDFDTQRGFFAMQGDAENVTSALREVLEEQGIQVEYVPDSRHEEEPEKWSNRPGLRLTLQENQDMLFKVLRAHQQYKASNPVLSNQKKLNHKIG